MKRIRLHSWMLINLLFRRFINWRGDPAKRSEMFFYTEFTDGDKVLLPYSKALSGSAQFEDFVFSQPQLFPLRFNANDAPKRITAMRRKPIRGIAIDDVFCLDLRYWGYAWFDDLDLPDAYATTYVVTCEYHALQVSPGAMSALRRDSRYSVGSVLCLYLWRYS